MKALEDLQARRDAQAREVMTFFREACALNMAPKHAARIALKGFDRLPRTDAESLRRRVARLMRYSRKPIPHWLPCGADDAEIDKRDAARREAGELAAMIKHARTPRQKSEISA